MAGTRKFDEEQAFTQALDLFWRKGYRATSMLDLAEATGVQRGSLYNAYGDKEEVFVRVFELYTAEFFKGVRHALGKPDVREALTAFFAFAIRFIAQGSPARGCLSTKTAIEANTESPRVRDALQKMLEALEAMILDTLSRPDAEARLAIPAPQAAKLIVTTTRGIAVMERVYDDPKSLRYVASGLIDALIPPQP